MKYSRFHRQHSNNSIGHLGNNPFGELRHIGHSLNQDLSITHKAAERRESEGTFSSSLFNGRVRYKRTDFIE